MDYKYRRVADKATWRDVMSEAYIEGQKVMFGKEGVVITIGPRTMTPEQNRRFHDMVGDIAEQQQFNGEWLDAKTWKMILISGHTTATTGEEPKLATGLEGETINLRESAAEMSVERSSSLIAYTSAWAAEHGVVWSH